MSSAPMSKFQIKRKLYAIKKGDKYLRLFSYNEGCLYTRFSDRIYFFDNKQLISKDYKEKGSRVVRLDITESEI